MAFKELRPFFSFYGGKWRAAKYYPTPEYDKIIEPFAGSAGYSLRHYLHKVTLLDADPIIAGIWQYLIRVQPEEIMALPVDFDHVDELHIPQEAKWLIGFWLNKGASSPCKTPSKWMKSGIPSPNNYWGTYIRERIASQVLYIKHWKAYNESYENYLQVPGDSYTWFVDPPYEVAGKGYRYRNIDYAYLAEWCKERQGQVIVCEQDGADWLPFEPFRTIKANESSRGGKVSKEVIWTS